MFSIVKEAVIFKGAIVLYGNKNQHFPQQEFNGRIASFSNLPATDSTVVTTNWSVLGGQVLHQRLPRKEINSGNLVN